MGKGAAWAWAVAVGISMAGAAPTFRNPIKFSSEDPCVVYQDGYYYAAEANWHSTPGSPIRLWRGKSLPTLFTEGQSADIPVDKEHVGIWAPELHKLGDRWYLIYSAEVSYFGRKTCVMESQGSDPFGAYALKQQDFRVIDWTYYQRADGSLWGLYADGGIQITRLKNPYTLQGNPAKLTDPNQPWEQKHNNWVEGPYVFDHGGKIFCTYSAGGWDTDDYGLGLLYFKGTDQDSLNDPSKWGKVPGPVFASARGLTGPGHNSIVKSPDGKEYWNVYHAHPYSGVAIRELHLDRIAWKADGFPDFGQPSGTAADLAWPSGCEPPAATRVEDKVEGAGPGQITYSGAWTSVADTACSGGGAHRTAAKDASFRIAFTGTKITVYARRDSASGQAAFAIDDSEQVVDLYCPYVREQTLAFSTLSLPAGPHTLKVRNTGDQNPKAAGAELWVDRIEILAAGTTVAGPAPARARGGHFPGAHRDWNGRALPPGSRAPAAPPTR